MQIPPDRIVAGTYLCAAAATRGTVSYTHLDVEQTIIEPVDGKNIVTTLDVGIQQIVEKYVNGFKKKMGAKNIGVVVQDPNTGEILAMDAGDRYDLNDPRDLSSLYSEEEIKACLLYTSRGV